MSKMSKILISMILLLIGYSNIVRANTIKIYVQAAPGGAIDLTARTLSKILAEQNIDTVVINQAGAFGDIAYNTVLNEKDTAILAGAAATFIFSSVEQDRNNPYPGTMKLIAPVVKTPMAFLTSPAGYLDFQSLVTSARASNLPCAVSNAHGTSELKRINKEYSTKFEPVSYKGSAPVALDLTGNHIKCAYDSVGTHIARHEDKQVKILAVTHKIDSLPIPLASSVLPKYTFENWYGFAIANDSILLKNQTLIESIKNFKSSTHSQFMLNAGFILELTREDIAKEVQEQTELYRKLK